jgi:hypothetical protein
MVHPNIVPGDRVVDLVASLRFAALVGGAIACAVSLWIITGNGAWALAALIVGGIAGKVGSDSINAKWSLIQFLHSDCDWRARLRRV